MTFLDVIPTMLSWSEAHPSDRISIGLVDRCCLAVLDAIVAPSVLLQGDMVRERWG